MKRTVTVITLILLGVIALLVLQMNSAGNICERTKYFSQYRQDLYMLRDLMIKLDQTTNIRGFISKMGEDRDLLNLNAGGLVPLNKAIDHEFAAYKNDLLKVKSIVGINRIGYINIEDGKALWVTMSGGGALGVDYGYVWTQDQPLPTDHKLRSCVIPGEPNWYVFSR